MSEEECVNQARKSIVTQIRENECKISKRLDTDGGNQYNYCNFRWIFLTTSTTRSRY